MKEHPILFSAPMVQAILGGRKTQTRRVMKRQPNIDPQTGDWLFTYSDGGQEVHPIDRWIDIQVKLHCPYGQPGDRIWVRESWAKQLDNKYIYRADFPNGYKADYTATGNWKPSIFMPRAASRITLEITDIRCERLNDISGGDAVAEGIKVHVPVPGDGDPMPKLQFRNLWQSINGSESWKANPYVWVISFRRIN